MGIKKEKRYKLMVYKTISNKTIAEKFPNLETVIQVQEAFRKPDRIMSYYSFNIKHTK
jgi:hypothetical protein